MLWRLGCSAALKGHWLSSGAMPKGSQGLGSTIMLVTPVLLNTHFLSTTLPRTVCLVGQSDKHLLGFF